jgi:GDP-L-fucose synthase
MMNFNEKIFVAGHNGMVGSALVRKLQFEGYKNLILVNSTKLDLRNQKSVEEFFQKEKIEYVFVAAGKVGGILANVQSPAEFLYDNLMIQANIIHSAYKNNVKKLLLLGSSCIYPKFSKQPIKEEYLLTGPLEETNEAYAIAKIAGIQLCKFYNKQYGCNFISLMPTNLYGENDNFNLETSHVLPALLRKIHDAKVKNKKFVELWGTGNPLREFLHVDDLADACIFMMNNYSGENHVNIGSGDELTILELSHLISKIVGFEGELKFDKSKPDGTYRKKLDINLAKSLGWERKIPLEYGINLTYRWFVKNESLIKS